MLNIPMNPPLDWFSPPESGIPTDRRITIEPDGRVYGYIAVKDVCHVGHGDCRTAPIGVGANYDIAHQGETLTASGEVVRTAVVPGGVAHAGPSLNAEEAAEVYANTGNQLMRVRYGEDENGLWFAGSLFPDVNELDIVKIRASGLSGDWRWQQAWRKTDDGKAAFVGACLVNIPGIPVPSKTTQMITGRRGRPLAMVASLHFPNADEYIDESGGGDMGQVSEGDESMTADAGSGCSCGGGSDAVDTVGDGDSGSTATDDGAATEVAAPEQSDLLASIVSRQEATERMIAEVHADMVERKRREKADKLFAAFDD